MLGRMIKEKREERKLSLKSFGKACGISDSEMLKIENGERKTPNWNTLCRIAEQLELHPVELLCKAGFINEKYILPYSQIHKLELLNEEEFASVQLFIDFLITRRNSEEASIKGEEK